MTGGEKGRMSLETFPAMKDTERKKTFVPKCERIRTSVMMLLRFVLFKVFVKLYAYRGMCVGNWVCGLCTCIFRAFMQYIIKLMHECN